MSFLRGFVLFSYAMMLVGCSTSMTRVPTSAAPSFKENKIKHLRYAAENGLLIQISDSLFRDNPIRQLNEKCKKIDEIDWPEQIYSVIQVFENNPKLLAKVHAIELKRGDQAQAEISRDLDGGTYLTINYAKLMTRKKIESPSDIPCAEQSLDSIGKEVTITHFEWPNKTQIASVLQGQEDKPNVERFNIDKRFLLYLANRMTILRLTPELSFEKNSNGSSLLVSALAELGQQAELNSQYPYLEYWMKEIYHRSHVGHQINFFGLRRSSELVYGIQVDSAGKFSRKLNGHLDPTYPYLTFRSENDQLKLINLSQLNQCLHDLTKAQTSFIQNTQNFELDPGSFLYPGYHCTSEN